MKKEITPSEFYNFIERQNIPAELSSHFTFVIEEGRRKFEVVNVDIEGDENDYLHILPFADYTFINVKLKGISYSGEPSQHDRFISPILNFFHCQISSLEIRGKLDSVVTLNHCNVTSELRIIGKVQSLNLHLGQNNIISSIWLGQEQREEGSSLMLAIISEDTQGYQIQQIEVEDLPINLTIVNVGVENLRINSNYKVRVELSSSTIKSIKFSRFIGGFEVNSSKIGEFMSPHDISENANFRFRGASIDACIINTFEKFESIQFANNCEIGRLILRQGDISKVQILGCNIDLLYLDIGRFNFKELIVSKSLDFDTHINHLIFSGGIFKNFIKLEDFTISRISFLSLINKSDIFVTGISYHELTNIKTPQLIDDEFPLNEYSIFVGEKSNIASNRRYETFIDSSRLDFFEVFNSDLGKINFISCDFSDMKLAFKASKITEIFLSGSEMPDKMVGNYQDRQVGYAQLKKVYDNRGDSVRSNDYLAKELDAHYQSLKRVNMKVSDPRFKERTWTQSLDYFTLKLHKNSNNFGTSWWTSLLWVLFGSFPLYLLYVCSIAYVPAWPHENAIFYGWEISSFFLEFLFPIHKADFIPEALGLTANPFSRILESVSRLLNGYIIYQFIAAFRKYGKK